MTGPFAESLRSAGPATGNLAWRAAEAFRTRFGGPHWTIALDKRLPLAAGIGGGSADAAAVLRLLAEAASIARDDAGLVAIARDLGADVPACLLCRPCIARGIGEVLEPLDHLPPVPLLLVNPGIAVSTAAVFDGWSAPAAPPPLSISRGDVEGAGDARGLARALAGTSNMLQPAAIRLAPEIGTVLAELGASHACLLARMSGSGATCFGLFAEAGEVSAAAWRLRARHPDWWVSPGRLCGYSSW